ncbi:hypothetical protein HOH51_01435 [bacterium]|nr:hypothetical protein [bacterium]
MVDYLGFLWYNNVNKFDLSFMPPKRPAKAPSFDSLVQKDVLQDLNSGTKEQIMRLKVGVSAQQYSNIENTCRSIRM